MDKRETAQTRYLRKYRQTDKYKDYIKTYQEEHKDKIKLNQKNYYLKNKGRLNEKRYAFTKELNRLNKIDI